ncbi:hypothetical protein EBE87_25855 [Pseudoroseomonas wenyumeiae]|uniref:Uncharacterized protein n=1 Tax=Teichococcus wenyumeiae TaxID=2478470 RepID=A0A3A9JCY5_9PROT|nr:hypothetical protein [Pseudoroseomonas wenyumeiae]RKK03301.1 hypothetical protein D6Z83_15185 [Pseudoroseomonas wenyumeiae]RMI15404.1 hypothetical protein EBE87_25855 [Pseudoroseomonas wenyumeiae]
MPRATRVIDRGWGRLVRDIKAMQQAEVKVGVRAGPKDGDGMEVLQYAAHNEFGTEHIPARPFMRHTADTAASRTASLTGRLGVAVIAGRLSVPDALKSLGAFYKDRIQNTIRHSSSWAEPNDPKTIAQKKGSTTPLVDHAVLVNTIDYVVEKKRSG